MGEKHATRTTRGPGSFLQDHPGRPGEVQIARDTVRRTLRETPGASDAVLAAAVTRALDTAGIAATQGTVQKLIGALIVR